MDVMSLATELNLVGKLVYNVLYKWVEGWGIDSDLIGAFGVTVILFTVFLTILTLPLDIWQKMIGRSNSRKMRVMKPELDKINKLYAADKNTLMMKQRELYKKYKYSTFKTCLPMLATLIIFFVIFSGFNSSVRYHNSVVYEELRGVYNAAFEEAYVAADATGADAATANAQATAAAEQAVLDAYKPESFLLTTSIFMPDTWKDPIPDVSTFTGTGLGSIGVPGIDAREYNDVMKPLIEKYNYTESGKSAWNGYLILPVLVTALSIISSKLIKPPEQPQVAGQTDEQVKAQQSQMKMMQYIMPIMMGVFSLFYSAAFSLYMFLRSFLSFAFNLIWNIVLKKRDAKQLDYEMSVTVKK